MILEMAEEAVKESIVPVKGSMEKESEKLQAENINAETTNTSAKEVVDEVCSDFEYKSRSPDDDKAIPTTAEISAIVSKPPPVRDRSLGEIKYYMLTIEDPSDDEIY